MYECKVKVDRDCIARGKKQSIANCPLAIALNEQTVLREATVGNSMAAGLHPDEFGIGLLGAVLDSETIEWIKMFDRGRDVQPIDVELEFIKCF